jgi:hypothetical protein
MAHMIFVSHIYLYCGGSVHVNARFLTASSGKYSSNFAVGAGGRIRGFEASMRFEEVEFSDNTAWGSGDAIAVNRSITQLAGTIFEENVASNGDALFIADDLNPEVTQL